MKRRRLFDLGKMRQRVRVHEITRVEDGSGGFDRQDPAPATLIGTYWGCLEPVVSREAQWGEAFTEQTTHYCWLRCRSTIKPGQTAVIDTPKLGTRYFYIESVLNPDVQGRYIMLMLREGGPL